MCYPVCGMVHIKEPLLLIVKSSLCGSSGFPFSLSEEKNIYRDRSFNNSINRAIISLGCFALALFNEILNTF